MLAGHAASYVVDGRVTLVSEGRQGLVASAEPLVDAYDCAMLDLDGVVYIGPAAVDGVPALLVEVRDRGMTVAFVTNNAARTPESVAEQLGEFGVHAQAADVVTAAQAAARELATRLEAGAKVLVIGGEGLYVALRDEGLTPVGSAADEPAAVVQGFDRSVGWTQLAEGCYAIQAGALWVASNLDRTIPTAGGVAPGNGTLVDAVAAAVASRPSVVAGKPYRPLFDETVRRTAAERPIVVGDRLDTDIEGANRCEADSLLVMTGVTDVARLCSAPRQQRPTYVAWTMSGLLTPHPTPERTDDGWSLNGWVVSVGHDNLDVASRGDDDDDGLRVVVSAAWAWYDDHGGVAGADLAGIDELWPGQ